MNDEARIWLNFMTYNIQAQSHICDVSEDSAALLYLLMTGAPVNIPYIIRNQILHCLNNTRTKLVYPHLITDMCKRHGVPSLPTDLYLDPATSRAYLSGQNRARKRGKRPVGEAPEEEEEAQEEAAAGGSSFTLSSLHDQLTSLTQSVGQLSTEFDGFRATYMANELRRQRFVDPLLLQLVKAQGIPLPEGFEAAFWANTLPASTYFPMGPGESSGAHVGEAQGEGGQDEEGGQEGEEGQEEEAGQEEGEGAEEHDSDA